MNEGNLKNACLSAVKLNHVQSMDNSGSRKARIAVNKTQGDVSTKTKVLYQLGLPLPPRPCPRPTRPPQLGNSRFRDATRLIIIISLEFSLVQTGIQTEWYSFLRTGVSHLDPIIGSWYIDQLSPALLGLHQRPHSRVLIGFG